ncbi:flavodoxin family protein [bacterium]|nr:flavodoxin family protein [bacterium]
MKVLLVNGSPRANGCTFTALSEVAKELERLGIDTEFFQIGNKPVRGCIGCRKCRSIGKCVFDDDLANELAQKMKEADGFVLGSPVYFAGPNGAFCALLDRVFFSCSDLHDKVCASVVSCRREGSSAAFDRLNKYFTIRNCMVATSTHWNTVHGDKPEDVLQDLEGLQTLRTLAVNMAAMLKNFNGEGAERAERETKKFKTSFIR